MPYHDRLALVLNDMTRPANLVAASQADKLELVGGIYAIVCFRCGGVQVAELPLGCHVALLARRCFAERDSLFSIPIQCSKAKYLREFARECEVLRSRRMLRDPGGGGKGSPFNGDEFSNERTTSALHGGSPSEVVHYLSSTKQMQRAGRGIVDVS